MPPLHIRICNGGIKMTLSPPIADATAPPFVDGRKVLCNGKVEPWTGPVQEVFAPIFKRALALNRLNPAQAAGSEEKARMDEAASLKALDAAVASWSHGRGEPPFLSAGALLEDTSRTRPPTRARPGDCNTQVSEKMRVWHEEQFGPLVPVVPFRELDDVYAYLAQSTFGQQASVFAGDVVKLAPRLALERARPDYLPFSGRKSSALGTLSVTEALKTVSTEYVVATKDNAMGKAGMLSLAGAQCNCVASLI
ncbi:hypothetical protein EMIHUDRAFT_456412 [Emiliania huxleyi CCMP1516]|uniref:Aldehyde dehydrogenase domain-containing protein n=2 Tax=Emiliania huxleyi TaxID=2903 RepID=A0A0D3K539_EMIH1|nr:hypothetical protein EMIHUDRAFT_456412 [Emiliania huxleyi CCMP1516]EOD30874.1 hypothetical protein EMIHUDRAFT_456412 [Emiliania huxleyi CCMP1516]|eukprot:XP_005783303.1 hypothetical protein EMIHUDRAFT_456412 [Emiliania huxleyi CCMP1516]